MCLILHISYYSVGFVFLMKLLILLSVWQHSSFGQKWCLQSGGSLTTSFLSFCDLWKATMFTWLCMLLPTVMWGTKCHRPFFEDRMHLGLYLVTYLQRVMYCIVIFCIMCETCTHKPKCRFKLYSIHNQYHYSALDYHI